MSAQPATEELLDEDQDRWTHLLDQGQLRVEYEFQYVAYRQLFVDYHEDIINGDGPLEQSKALAYQRKQDKIAKRIVKDGVRPDLFGTLIVNARPDDSYAIVDGGTRYRALQQLQIPPDALIPCLVFHWDDSREIRNYVALNQERSGLTQVDIFVARVKYGDPDATAINKALVEETGHGVGYKKGNWQCVNALVTAHRRGNLYRVLVTMRQLGWLDQPGGKTQTFVGAIDRLLQLGADPDKALAKWSGVAIAQIQKEAKEHNIAVGSRSVAKAVALNLGTKYNKGLRSGKINLAPLTASQGTDDLDEDE